MEGESTLTRTLALVEKLQNEKIRLMKENAEGKDQYLALKRQCDEQKRANQHLQQSANNCEQRLATALQFKRTSLLQRQQQEEQTTRHEDQLLGQIAALQSKVATSTERIHNFSLLKSEIAQRDSNRRFIALLNMDKRTLCSDVAVKSGVHKCCRAVFSFKPEC